MKSQNIFPDQVGIDRPIFRKFRIVRLETNPGEIGDQCVEPHVKDVVWIIRDRNAPLQRHAANRQVLQAGLHERYDFIAPAFGPDEAGVLFVKVKKTVLEYG